jgi:hypothetical protein
MRLLRFARKDNVVDVMSAHFFLVSLGRLTKNAIKKIYDLRTLENGSRAGQIVVAESAFGKVVANKRST